jgi:hypothetical protein
MRAGGLFVERFDNMQDLNRSVPTSSGFYGVTREPGGYRARITLEVLPQDRENLTPRAMHEELVALGA